MWLLSFEVCLVTCSFISLGTHCFVQIVWSLKKKNLVWNLQRFSLFFFFLRHSWPYSPDRPRIVTFLLSPACGETIMPSEVTLLLLLLLLLQVCVNIFYLRGSHSVGQTALELAILLPSPA